MFSKLNVEVLKKTLKHTQTQLAFRHVQVHVCAFLYSMFTVSFMETTELKKNLFQIYFQTPSW